MRILLIGGSGFIGRHVIERLQARGHEVILFHRGTEDRPLPEGVQVIEGNRLDIGEHVPALLAARPHVAVDFLPWNDTDTRGVIRALNGRVERVVHLSSGDVYRAWGHFLTGREGEPVPIGEESPLRDELYPYAGTDPGMADYDKVLAEREVLSAHFNTGYPATILRLPMVYGPGDGHHRTWRYVRRMLDGRRAIVLSGTQAAWLWHRGYVENVAFAIVLAAERPNSVGQVYNVGSPQTLTMAGWVRAIGRAMQWDGQVVIVPFSELPDHLRQPYDYQQHILFDTSKIRRDLGYYELVDAAEAIQRTVDWQAAHPPETFDNSIFDYAAEDALLERLGMLA